MDKSSRDYFKDPDSRVTSPDVIPSSEMQFDLSRFVLVGREFFGHSSIFSPVENFFAGREFFG